MVWRDYQPAALEIDVVDDGQGRAVQQWRETGGLGLIGDVRTRRAARRLLAS